MQGNKNLVTISSAIGLLFGISILPRLFDPFDRYNLFFENNLGITLFVNLIFGLMGLTIGSFFGYLLIKSKLDKKEKKISKNGILLIYLYSVIIYYSILIIKQAYAYKKTLPSILGILIPLFFVLFVFYSIFCLFYFIKKKFSIKIYISPILNLVILLIPILFLLGVVQLPDESQRLETSPIFFFANVIFILYLFQIFWALFLVLKYKKSNNYDIELE